MVRLRLERKQQLCKGLSELVSEVVQLRYGCFNPRYRVTGDMLTPLFGDSLDPSDTVEVALNLDVPGGGQSSQYG